MPEVPSADLVNWLGGQVEPCAQCGKIHANRYKYVCHSCNNILCRGRCARVFFNGVQDKSLWHVEPLKKNLAICGTVQKTTDLWPETHCIDSLLTIVKEMSQTLHNMG